MDVPKDGHFGAVVVGSSLAEEYPETVGVWSGRLVYTVYLHVGLPKSWILQYGLPHSAEASAAGRVVRPEAPWPYLMERFQLAPGDSDADAVMIHGFVNAGGRFENLAIVFPTEFAQAKFVLNALAQWQFRPAVLNGKIAAVEVLLIIPDQGGDEVCVGAKSPDLIENCTSGAKAHTDRACFLSWAEAPPPARSLPAHPDQPHPYQPATAAPTTAGIGRAGLGFSP